MIGVLGQGAQAGRDPGSVIRRVMAFGRARVAARCRSGEAAGSAGPARAVMPRGASGKPWRALVVVAYVAASTVNRKVPAFYRHRVPLLPGASPIPVTTSIPPVVSRHASPHRIGYHSPLPGVFSPSRQRRHRETCAQMAPPADRQSMIISPFLLVLPGFA